MYFQESDIAGCEPAIVTNGLQDSSDYIKSRYCIGPVTRREFWEQELSDLEHHGPCESPLTNDFKTPCSQFAPGTSSKDYLEAIAHREIDWIQNYANPQEATETPWQYTSQEQQTSDAHIALLRKFLCAIPHIIPKDPDLVSPRLWHPDFHAGNIYVDDQGRVSSIIDWQGVWITPVFIGANPPLLLDYGVEMLMNLPDNFKDLDGTTKEQLRY